MNAEDKIKAALNEFDVQEYIMASRTNGRANMDIDIRARAVKLYKQIQTFLVDEPFISRELEATLELTQRTLFSEWFLYNNKIPRYPAYTNVRVLNWVLGTNRRTPLPVIWSKCWTTIRALLQDIISFEICSLAGVEHWQPRNFDRTIAGDRVERLRQLRGSVTTFKPYHSPIVNVDEPPRDWFAYANDESRVLAVLHLTALPQTQEHDEVLFLRTIHVGECCFWGVLTGVIGGMESVKRGRLDVGIECLEEAASFAKFLVPLLQAFKTMPPEHFTNFRDATGNSSAIQSRTYQLMQIFTQGLDERKAPILASIPEVEDLPAYGDTGFISLRTLLRTIDPNDPEGSAFLAAATALDKELYAWRCLHLGIARHYLPPSVMGTGGTIGVPYLDMHYRRKILSPHQQYPALADIQVRHIPVVCPVLSHTN
jgi:tryptophan 2,3-dioxygenase